ncbi:Protein ROH1-like [Dillenia turbinata]|uniref:Protein ROH1-like n=1 Tax=Dillenia turbinata TaxID=194707 RepID=A0AAN8VHZ1_9MAGN
MCLSLKFNSKLENHSHHHDQTEALLASLKAFQSEISVGLNLLASNSKPGFEILSFPWILKCLEIFPIMNKAFSKLLVETNYPLSTWKGNCIDEYLNYSLRLLDMFNSISSSLSRLSHARILLSHAVSLIPNSPSLAAEKLKGIQLPSLGKVCGEKAAKKDEIEVSSINNEWVIHQALVMMKSIGFWIGGIVLSCLCGDVKPYMETREMASEISDSLAINLDERVFNEVLQNHGAWKEVIEINEEVDRVFAAMATADGSKAAEELKRRLQVFDKFLGEVKGKTNHLFSEVMAQRGELLDCLRRPNNGRNQKDFLCIEC